MVRGRQKFPLRDSGQLLRRVITRERRHWEKVKSTADLQEVFSSRNRFLAQLPGSHTWFSCRRDLRSVSIALSVHDEISSDEDDDDSSDEDNDSSYQRLNYFSMLINVSWSSDNGPASACALNPMVTRALAGPFGTRIRS